MDSYKITHYPQKQKRPLPSKFHLEFISVRDRPLKMLFPEYSYHYQWYHLTRFTIVSRRPVQMAIRKIIHQGKGVLWFGVWGWLIFFETTTFQREDWDLGPSVLCDWSHKPWFSSMEEPGWFELFTDEEQWICGVVVGKVNLCTAWESTRRKAKSAFACVYHVHKCTSASTWSL